MIFAVSEVYCDKINKDTKGKGKPVHVIYESWGSSVSIVSDYGLEDQGSIPGRGKGLFF
jgi:hypothetical protein